MNDLEQQIEFQIPKGGFREDLSPMLGGWRNASGLTLTASTKPEIITVATSLVGMLKWDHDDATTDFLLLSGLMPRQFAELLDDLAIVCVARKVDATADENADLCLQAQVRWFQPGTLDRPDVQSASDTAPTLTAGDSALGALTTPAKALLAGTLGANSNLTGFGTYVIDIGERLRAEEARIEAGSVLQIEFGPDDTPGTTDMDIEIAPPILCLRRHVGLYMSGNPGRNPRHD